MKQVQVPKADLLQVLQENRERHVNTFEQVLRDYRDEAVRQLEAHVERIRAGAVEQVFVSLPAPQDYEKEYDRAITMVEWEIADVIDLSEAEFTRYVLDEWPWKPSFDESVATYSSR